MTFGSTRQGNIAVLTIIIVIAITILLNLLIRQLPDSVTKLDFSNQKIYDISDTSKNFLAGLNDDIDLYLLSGGDTDKRITKFVNDYAKLSEHITVHEIDVLESPSYLTKFECEADSLVVSCEATGKYTAVSYSGSSNALILTTVSYDSGYNMTTQESSFDAEGQLTSAIDYVTGDVSDTIYTLTGHGEQDLPTGVTDLISKSNVGVGEAQVNLLMDGKIPEDCSMLVCYAPGSDLADDELTALSDYMKEGGKLLLVLDDSSLSNFNALLGEYGLTMLEGYVGDQAKFYQNYANYYGYFCFAPTYPEDSELTGSIEENSIMIYSRGMTESEPARDGIKVTPFLTTSESGINYIDDNNYTEGQFITGAVAEEKTDDEHTARLTVITARSFLDDGITSQFTNMANLDIFMNVFTANFDNVSNFAIEAKSLQVTYNTITNYGFFSIMFIVVIPLAIIIGGLVYWLKRRKL